MHSALLLNNPKWRRLLFFCSICSLSVLCYYSAASSPLVQLSISKLADAYYDITPATLLRKKPLLFPQTTTLANLVFEYTAPIANLSVHYQSIDGPAYADCVGTAAENRCTYVCQLIGLTSSSYAYALRAADRDTYRSTFVWPTPLAEEVTILAFADNQWNARTFISLLQQASKSAPVPDLVLHLGDAVQDAASHKAWQTDYWRPLATYFQHTPILHSPGNHDHTNDTTFSLYGGHVDPTRTWKAVTVANAIRIVSLDSNVDSAEQDEWLLSELESEEWKSAAFRIVNVHVPPFIEYWDAVMWQKGERNWCVACPSLSTTRMY